MSSGFQSSLQHVCRWGNFSQSRSMETPQTSERDHSQATSLNSSWGDLAHGASVPPSAAVHDGILSEFSTLMDTHGGPRQYLLAMYPTDADKKVFADGLMTMIPLVDDKGYEFVRPLPRPSGDDTGCIKICIESTKTLVNL